MRLLWARIGIAYSPATGLPIESQTVSQMVDRVMALPEGTRLYLLAPVVRGRKGEYRKELAEYLKKGFQRVKVDGMFYEIGAVPTLDKKFKHDIDVVVDRVVVRQTSQRLAESFETALSSPTASRWRSSPSGTAVAVGGGSNAADREKNGERKQATAAAAERLMFSEKFACPVSGFTIAGDRAAAVLVQQSVRRLSGLRRSRREAALRSPTWSFPTRTRPCAVAPSRRGRSSTSPYYTQTLEALARHYKFSLETHGRISARRRRT